MLSSARTASATAVLALAVAPLPLHAWPARNHSRPLTTHTRAVKAPPATTAHPSPAVQPWSRPRARGDRELHFRPAAPSLHARAAGDPAATISDFKFTPSTTTIHVGETVTWTNNGPNLHTATAKDGSFNTGTLKKGASASHTFTQAGTFPYICAIHPFMHGTIVVLANASSASGSSPPPAAASDATSPSSGAGAGTGAGSTTTTAAAGSGTLPVTGLDLVGTVATGLGLLGLGLGLRRRSQARGH